MTPVLNPLSAALRAIAFGVSDGVFGAPTRAALVLFDDDYQLVTLALGGDNTDGKPDFDLARLLLTAGHLLEKQQLEQQRAAKTDVKV
jgi:hypothetical protein